MTVAAPAAPPPRIHPAAWAVALALHGALGLALIPRGDPPPPAGPPLSVGLAGLGGGSPLAPAGGAGMLPAEAAAAEAGPDLAPVDADAAGLAAPPVDAAPTELAAAQGAPAAIAAVAPLAEAPSPPPPEEVAPARQHAEAPAPAEAIAAQPPPDLATTAPPDAAETLPPPAPPPRLAASPRQNAPAAAARRVAPAGTARPSGPPAAFSAASSTAAAAAGTAGGPPDPAVTAGAPAGGAGGADELVRLPPAYAAAIARILQRGLRYPPPARDAGIEGQAVVQFSIARDGAVLSPRILRSSGSVLLDHEALALLRRVSPLPRLPDQVPGSAAAVVVPIGFALR